MPDFLRPDLDVTDGNWTDQAGGTVLYAAVDEASASDADYIKSAANPSQDVVRLRLSNPLDGVSLSQDVRIKYRYARDGDDPINIQVRLKEGANTIATWTVENVTTSFITANQLLTTDEKNAVTNWDNLEIEIEANPVLFNSPLDLGTKLTAWYDFTDPTVLFTDAARTPGNEVSTTGDFIRSVADKSGNGYHLNNATAVNTWDAVNNQITMVGGANNRYQLSPVIPNASQLTEAFATIKTSDTQWWLFRDYWGYWMLRVDASNSVTTDAISRGGTVADLYKDGSLVASDPTTPAALAALMDGSSVLFSIYPTTGLVGWGEGTQELFADSYYSMDGTMTHIVLCEGLTADERANLETWLMARKPV